MTTTTSPRPTPSPPPDAPARPKRFGLSWTQIIAAGFASITATVILSFFSISGTLIGAAVFSMASAIGNAVYGQSLRSTTDKVASVAGAVRSDPASPTVVMPAPGEAEGDLTTSGSADGEAPRLPAAPAALPARAWKRVAVFALAIFATVMTTVTVVELIAGRPLTDVLRGQQGSGTSLLGGTSGGGAPAAPTVTVTVTPSVVTTTPTVTVTAPTRTQTSTPSPSGDAGSGTGSDTPSSGTPSAPSGSSSGSDTSSPTGSSTGAGR